MSYIIKADKKDSGEKYEPFWSFCVGAGRANEGLRAGWQEQLDTVVKNCGFRYIRFHGLFHDDMCVYREEEGEPVYNWQYVHDLFDRLLDKGIKPFVELGFCPREIASIEETCFWWKGHGSPPKDYDKWGALVESFVNNCIERYGIAEVRSWYFEVWNEPNLDFFFAGTKSQYFKLYKVSAEVIKKIDPQLRVGGPATSNFVPDERFDGETEDTSKHKTWSRDDIDAFEWKGVWIEDFLNYCTENKLPVDFISTHPYPTDFAIDPDGKAKGQRTRSVDSTRVDLLWLKKTVEKSVYPEAEIHLTEWNSSPAARDFSHDYIQAATYIVKCNVESIGIVESLSYWTFTDIFEEHRGGDTAFHGGFGMITFQGIPKPAFHAYRMLSKLGDEILSRDTGSIVTRDSSTGKIAALCYHYPPEIKKAVPTSKLKTDMAEETASSGSKTELEISLSGLSVGSTIEVDVLDRSNGSAIEMWLENGAPHSPNRELTEKLKSCGWATEKTEYKADADGCFNLQKEIEPWAVLLVREK
ncbi:MAG: GH39 family glycosyl hydrolase [Planctomycetota bacterium]|jgi:xylan 1,4-beta-xylosidase